MEEIAGADVSRETLERLKAYQALIEKWSPRINLVSRGDIKRVWERHIVDSAQVYLQAPRAGHWVDLGSGGGFPGIVCAIMSHDQAQGHTFTFVDSDQRKCVFLRTAVRELGLEADIYDKRIEEVPPLGADILSARALGGLEGLLGFTKLHLKPDGVAFFPKGKSWMEEHTSARKTWSYTLDSIMSTTNPDATILKITEISRV